MAGPDLAKLAGQFGKMHQELSGPAMRKRISLVAEQCAKIDARQAVISDLGDTSMSHWWRRKPIDVLAFSKDIGELDALVAPKGRAVGPMRVLQDGRQAGRKGAVSGFRGRTRTTKVSVMGTELSSKSQHVVATKFRRNTGSTAAKHTWSDAVELFDKRAPARLLKSELAAYRGIFRG